MSPKSSLLFTFLLGSTASLVAAPLAETTPVYAGPDIASAPVTSLPAGTETTLAPGINAPAGWTAVTLAGPHDVYAPNKNVTKSLDVRAGTPYLTEARDDAPVLALAAKDDVAEITDYRGKFTKFRLTRPVVGYIKTPVQAVSAAAAPVTTPTTVASNSPAPIPGQQVGGVGRAAPAGDGASSALPRLYQGKLASTQSPLRPRRPYDYQLTDEAGARYAYVDVSKLLATEQITKYTGRTVVVYGTAKAVPGTRDMVVVAESLQLR
jgi:hypothetical protein